MKILVLSFYYPPDLCAGSFRASSLVQALLPRLPEDAELELFTTAPNRYSTFASEAPEFERLPQLTIHRIALPPHKSGMVDQGRAFVAFARQVLARTRGAKYALVVGTSSRLMTAALSALIARRQQIPLYLDIRDIFVDTIKDVLPREMGIIAKPLFSAVERWTIASAAKVNLVSGGFKEYFQSRFPGLRLSFFTNGIDPEFRAFEASSSSPGGPARGAPVVLYAGNMGEGQGLHAIVPELAHRLDGSVRFRLIGDGGRKSLLEKRLGEMGCRNVEVLPPVNRTELLAEYRNADILFLHLNDHDAFRKVLPSKLFEYAATGKPIWAGVSGFSADFIRSEIRNAEVFPPCKHEEAIRAFHRLAPGHVDRTDFVQKYSREEIMSRMADDVLSLVS